MIVLKHSILLSQMNIITVLGFLVIFMGVELAFISSVLWSVGDGSWIILVFGIVMNLIMYVWNCGSKLKYETEVEQKMSVNVLRDLGCSLGTVRAPGIGLVYNELVKGMPAIFGHFLTNLPAVHSMIIFVFLKYVPMSMVPQIERFLFWSVWPKSYHMFRCIAKYGCNDVRKENHHTFEQLPIESLGKFVVQEAQERSLESDGDERDMDSENESLSRVLIAPNLLLLLAEVNLKTGSPADILDAEQSLEREVSFVHLNEDLCMEILKRLPNKLLCRIRCVCKSWNSLIISPLVISVHNLYLSSRKSNNDESFFLGVGTDPANPDPVPIPVGFRTK